MIGPAVVEGTPGFTAAAAAAAAKTEPRLRNCDLRSYQSAVAVVAEGTLIRVCGTGPAWVRGASTV